MKDKKLFVTELISAAVITAVGIFLALAAANVFPFGIKDCYHIALTSGFTIISLVLAVQKNAIGTGACLCFLLLTAACIMLVSGINAYPLFIMAVPLGAAISAKMLGAKKLAAGSLSVAGAGAIFFFESSALLSIWVVLPMVAAYFGALGVIYAAVKLYKLHKENNENA